MAEKEFVAVHCPRCQTLTMARGETDHSSLSATCPSCGHGWLVNRLGVPISVEEDKATYKAMAEAKKQ